VISALIVAGVCTKNSAVTATGKHWARTVDVEKFDWVEKEDSSSSNYPDVPHGARDVEYWTSMESDTVTDDDGSDSVETYTEYHVRYDIQEWQYVRTVSADGDQSVEPYYPKVTLRVDPEERVSGTSEEYSVYFSTDTNGKKVKTYSAKSLAEYQAVKLDHKIPCKMNYLGCIVSIGPIPD
jgi:hypothetical protein